MCHGPVLFDSKTPNRTEPDSSVQLIRSAYRPGNPGNVIQVNYACLAYCNEILWFRCVETVRIPLRSVHRLNASQYKPLHASQFPSTPLVPSIPESVHVANLGEKVDIGSIDSLICS
jgi:hypothetical protein